MAEFNKELLGEELFKSVTEKLGDNQVFLHGKDQKVIIDDGTLVKKDGMIPKFRFDEVNEQKESYKTQVEEMTTEVGNLKSALKGNKEATAKIADLEEKLTGFEEKLATQKTESDTKDDLTKRKFALRDALREGEARPEYVDMLETRFKLDQLVIDEDGKIKSVKISDTDIKSFDEVLKGVKEAYPDSFGTTKRVGKKDEHYVDPNVEFYSKEELGTMSQADMVTNMDKVNKSVEHISKQTE